MTHHLDPQFVCLHVAQLHLALLDKLFMHLLAMLACPGQPVGDGSFIKAKGRHDGWDRAAMAEQGQHQGYHVRCRLQSVEDRAVGRDEGLLKTVQR